MKALLLFGIFVGIMGIVVLMLTIDQAESITPLIPFGHQGIQFAIIFFVLWPLLSILGAILFGYLLTPLFLIVHKKVIGRDAVYGIQEKAESKEFKKYFQGFFPALIAINLSLMVVDDPESPFMQFILHEPGEPSMVLPAFVIMLAFTICIALALFSPAWFLRDSGIVYSNKEKDKDTDKPIEIRSVGGWYIQLLKGYAGISVILTYYDFFMNYLPILMEGSSLFSYILIFILFIPMPIIVALSTIPAIILLDLTRESRKKYVKKIAMKYGVSDLVEVTFEVINKE